MNLVLKTSIKLIAYQLQSGLLAEELLKKLKPLFPQLTIDLPSLLSRLEPFLSKNKPVLIATKEQINHYNQFNKLEYYFFDDETITVIHAIYLLVCKANIKGNHLSRFALFRNSHLI